MNQGADDSVDPRRPAPVDGADAANDAGGTGDEVERNAETAVPTRDAKPAAGPERAAETELGSGRRASRLLDSALHSDALPERARCPFCGERDTEQFAAFGSAVSTSQYYCRRCRTVFEFMKRRRRG